MDNSNRNQAATNNNPPIGVIGPTIDAIESIFNKWRVAKMYNEPLKNNIPKVKKQPDKYNILEGKYLDSINTDNKTMV